MTEKQNIKIACMSLMWGFETTEEMLERWLGDVAQAGYEGAATFSDVLLTSCKKWSFAQRLSDLGLGLASIDWKFHGILTRCARCVN